VSSLTATRSGCQDIFEIRMESIDTAGKSKIVSP
jgi:hypothetical protein